MRGLMQADGSSSAQSRWDQVLRSFPLCFGALPFTAWCSASKKNSERKKSERMNIFLPSLFPLHTCALNMLPCGSPSPSIHLLYSRTQPSSFVLLSTPIYENTHRAHFTPPPRSSRASLPFFLVSLFPSFTIQANIQANKLTTIKLSLLFLCLYRIPLASLLNF